MVKDFHPDPTGFETKTKTRLDNNYNAEIYQDAVRRGHLVFQVVGRQPQFHAGADKKRKAQVRTRRSSLPFHHIKSDS
jgi:hypothetical protein